MDPIDHQLPLLESFQKEGKVSTVINPDLCLYPAFGQPLAVVLANTTLAIITDVDENDPLQLSPSMAKVVLCLEGIDSIKVDRLFKALSSIQAEVIAVDLHQVKNTMITNLGKFSKLKHLSIPDADVTALENLAESIESWGPQPPLTYCHVGGEGPTIPSRLVTSLSKCTHLKHLELSGKNLHDKLSILIGSPSPELRHLKVSDCSLQGSDIDHLTTVFREGRLTQLDKLDLEENPIGEAAVGHLLEAIISTRPHTRMQVNLKITGVDEGGDVTELTDEFIDEWKTKVSGTMIIVEGISKPSKQPLFCTTNKKL